MPDWRDDAACAVDLWLDRDGDRDERPERTLLGEARPEADGWYVVDLRDQDVDPDLLDELELVADGEPAGRRVTELVHEPQVLRARAPGLAGEAGLRLSAVRLPARLLLESLRDGLRGLADANGVAGRLAAGQLDGPAAGAGLPPAGLAPAQREAFEACFAPGVRLVGAPPGVQLTEALVQAIDQLLDQGRRVLLVSATGAGVDRTVRGVVERRDRPAGMVVRVGPPHDRAVAPVSLAGLAAARAAAALGRQPDPARPQDVRRIAAVQALQEAESAWEAIQPARSHLQQAARLRAELAELASGADHAAARRRELRRRDATMRAHLENAGSGGSLRMRPTGAGAAQLRRHVERLDLAVRQAEAAEAAAAELLEDRRRLLEPRIARHELLAAPFDEAAVERRREALEAARREAGRWSDERGIVGRARLVATTLTGFRLHRDVAAGRYDTVVADDVGGSPLAEIILPVAAARRTAVLLGDAADVGTEQPAGEEAPEVRRWLLGTCFGHRGAACAGR